MPSYQSFPYQAGASDSLSKLVCLRLPSLAGKSFLDVGCNEGYFCGYAQFEGARRVVGVDCHGPFLEKARRSFPGCEFRQMNWNELDAREHFDVILLASALHYAEDQPALLNRLKSMLTEDGVLVLEVGLAPGEEPAWVEVRRSIDTRLFPTRSMLDSLLKGHAVRYVGESCAQTGDPLPRFVYHVRRHRPWIFLLLEPPASGKTTLRQTCFRHLPAIVGDALLDRIADGAVDCPQTLRELVCLTRQSQRRDIAIENICREGMLADYLAVAEAEAGEGTVVFDGYIPRPHHPLVEAFFQERGRVPVLLSWKFDQSGYGSVGQTRQEARKYQMYLAAVTSKSR